MTPATAPDPRSDLAHAYEAAMQHLASVQSAKGAVGGEVIWNPMLVCQYVIACHVLGRPIDPDRRRRIRLALERQVRDDGGWGMHPDSESWLFHTTLCYVALRLLGHPPDDPLAAGALRWIRAHGGVTKNPTWGRIWLALLGLYPWQCVQPILPEMWLLPDATPVHPRRLYCHMRLIYLGLSYLYGARVQAPDSPVLRDIRDELYDRGYDRAPFRAHRDDIAATDLYEAPGAGLRAAFAAMRALDRIAPGLVRKKALARAIEHVLFELRSTGHVCLSPVNGLLFNLALHHHDARHPERDQAFRGLEYWFWEDDVDGTRICGARSDIWDTSFLLQAVCEGPRSDAGEGLARRAAAWLVTAQIRGDIPGGAEHYREPADGGWGFADERHPWPVSDCTAEALEALIHCADHRLAEPLARERQLAALRFVLRRQNEDGGFGSYEPRRGSLVLKHFNPAEIYGNCMLEYSYSECTASCVRGLALARRHLGDAVPPGLAADVDAAIERGVAFLLRAQHPDGGWLGFWGINFTYGTFFAVHALLAAGLPRQHPAIRRAVAWLVRHQRRDGGWGESFEGLLDGRDVQLPAHEPSLVAQTAWAVLTLMAAETAEESPAIERAIAYIRARQQADGSWPRERASGVFFNTAVLDYDLYRQIFPAWALARRLGRTAD
ncbi:prenyltransferase/squalene oxidase repeat-containing protein [Nannocystis radixulma]|uniref:Prenyltransferase/squalene oxidase repeat-containing protein n=1 Tax=Nannocystis radixulma TaxID=2995305 RepID=A0ABT5AZF5_9BACT|nr:prenyltransferase/squalene oxidase repeat-containing protein [Nannocystis radixulma]MDC0667213.1 prenyltransferase/squalene oxidase repeat-containing protein [Nannocystis radixulma]